MALQPEVAAGLPPGVAPIPFRVLPRVLHRVLAPILAPVLALSPGDAIPARAIPSRPFVK